MLGKQCLPTPSASPVCLEGPLSVQLNAANGTCPYQEHPSLPVMAFLPRVWTPHTIPDLQGLWVPVDGPDDEWGF